MRKWLGFGLVLCLLLIILTPGAYFGYLGWKYTHPDKKPLSETPEEYGLSYQDVIFPSRDEQVALRGWLIQAKKQERRIVIFAHGYQENRESANVALEMASALHTRDIASLLFDFRASGESGGEMTSFGYHEQQDLLGAIQYAKQQGYERIGLVGFSMGAATALQVAPEVPEVEAVIADSAYTDMESFFQGNLYQLHSEYGLFQSEEFQAMFADKPWYRHAFAFWQKHQETLEPMMMALVPKLVQWEMALLTGIQPQQMQPIAAVSALKDQGVFLIHSQGDSVIPVTESEQLEQASTAEHTILWVSKSPDHVGTFDKHPGEYIRRTTEFLGYHLRSAGTVSAEAELEDPEVVSVWRELD